MRAHLNPRATLDDRVSHLEHAAEVAGIEHGEIGCDFDGRVGADGPKDTSADPNLTFALKARGWTESDLGKRWGENMLRVFRTGETTSA